MLQGKRQHEWLAQGFLMMLMHNSAMGCKKAVNMHHYNIMYKAPPADPEAARQSIIAVHHMLAKGA
jgi:hypothetical protein